MYDFTVYNFLQVRNYFNNALADSDGVNRVLPTAIIQLQ